MDLYYISDFDPLTSFDIDLIENYERYFNEKVDKFFICVLHSEKSIMPIELKYNSIVNSFKELNIINLETTSNDLNNVLSLLDSNQNFLLKVDADKYTIDFKNKVSFNKFFNERYSIGTILKKSKSKILFPNYLIKKYDLKMSNDDKDNIQLLLNYRERESNSDFPYGQISKFDFDNEKLQKDIIDGFSLNTGFETMNIISENKLYFTKDIAKNMSSKRYLHSISTAKTAYEIALNNDLNPGSCYLAGILHDITKDMDESYQRKLIEDNLPDYKDCPPYMFHQFAGAILAKNNYNVSKDIERSIMFHTSGKREMTSFQKCIFAADKVEPTRSFSTKEDRDGCIKNIDEYFPQVLRSLVKFYKSKGIEYKDYFLSKEMYEYYLEEER